MHFFYRITLIIGLLFLQFTASSQIIAIGMSDEVIMTYDQSKAVNTSKINVDFEIKNGTGDNYFKISWKVKFKNVNKDRYEEVLQTVTISPRISHKSFEIIVNGIIDKCYISIPNPVKKIPRSEIESMEVFKFFNKQINSAELIPDLYKKRDRINEIKIKIQDKKNELKSLHYNDLSNQISRILSDLDDQINRIKKAEAAKRKKIEKDNLRIIDSNKDLIKNAKTTGIKIGIINETKNTIKQKQDDGLISDDSASNRLLLFEKLEDALIKNEKTKIRDAFDNKINKALTGKYSYEDQKKLISEAYKDVRKNFGVYVFNDSVYYNKEYSSQLEKINKKEKIEEENSIITVNNIIAKINDTKKYGIQKEILQNAIDSLNLFCKQNKIKETNCNNLNQTIQQKLVNITEMIRRVEKEEIKISPIASSRINPNLSEKLIFKVENEYLISQSKSCVWRLKKGNPRKITFSQIGTNLVVEKFDAFRYVFELTISYDNINSKSKEIEIIGDFSTKNTH